ncbi:MULTISPECIES: MaoC family dehydratase [unclassified Solwaraspora]|uniref:MaoC family dehydratase n=1 Tax=unclassified Solwaraspora TaxID=2627926 RepID=UPI00259BDC8B|nr:MaoC family dehydratase [Solwaraspora sp. WMMA2056]WJK39586.1 MaoC family dehydratase [Solwaraspora sp. WMMA2056]
MSATSAEPSVTVTAELVDTLIGRGGYTHPLFNPPDPGRDGGPPLPGQAVLLLMGGLAEQSGQLDDAIALLELRRMRFHRLVRAGTTLRVRIERLASRSTSSGKVVAELRWTAVDADGALLAEAEAVMLMNESGKADPR